MNKLIAQLKKELKRSPGKAAALGGGLLLAIWFWLPLLSEWFGGDPNNPHTGVAAAAATTSAPTATTGPIATTSEASKSPPIDWRTLAAWKQNDTFARPFVWHEGMRNPFIAMDTEETNEVAEAAEAEPQQEQQLAVEVAAQQLSAEVSDLQLTSTLITPRGNWATINGVNYQVGDPIDIGSQSLEAVPDGNFPTAEQEAAVQPTKLVLVRIEDQSVTLQAGNQYYPLKMKRPTNSAIQLRLR